MVIFQLPHINQVFLDFFFLLLLARIEKFSKGLGEVVENKSSLSTGCVWLGFSFSFFLNMLPVVAVGVSRRGINF